MRLRQLFEAEGKTAVLAFGRLNPPTVGHAKLVEKIKSVNGEHYLFLSQTQKPKTDPLDFATKVKFAKQFFPDVNVGHQSVRTPVQALEMLQGLGYTDIVFIAGSDRVEGFQKLFDTYNGQPDKTGKVPFKFNSIRVVSAGERDPDADDVSGMSASKMRAAAAAGELETFAKGVPDAKLAKTMYNAVRKGMGVKDTEPAEEDVNEFNLFKGADNASIKEQDPDKLKVMDYIASRSDNKEHFLSFYRKGAAWSGKLIFIKPDEAKKFMQKVEKNDDYLPQIKQALTSMITASKLFDRLNIKYQIRNAD